MKQGSFNIVFFFFMITTIGWVHAQQAIRETIAKQSETIKTVSAEFVQEKHLKILAKPMISKGKLYYQAPGSLRWEYFTPVRSILIANQGKTRRYIVKEAAIIEDTSARMQSTQIVMDEISRWISGRFDQNPDFRVEKKTGNTMILRPVNEAFSKIIFQIDIHLSDKPGVIQSVMIHENADSFTRLKFKNVTVNTELNPLLFTEIL